MFADNGDPKNPVLARYSQYLDKTMGRAVGDSPVEIVETVTGDLMGNTLLPRLLFIQANPRHLRLDKYGPGNYPVIDLEFFKVTKQGVDRRIPGLMGGGVGELVRAGDIAGGKNIGPEP